jgi:hypothetical protein
MPFSIGDWAIEVETDFVFQVTGISGQGRKSLVFSGSKSFYQLDCTPWYLPENDYEDIRRMISVVPDEEGDAFIKALASLFQGSEKSLLWNSLSNNQKARVMQLSAIAKQAQIREFAPAQLQVA